MTSDNQRLNVRAACEHLAPLAAEHELVISHGNGPQVGLLALQGYAYLKVPTYPFDILGAETFDRPTKPIGPFYSRAEVDDLNQSRGWTFRPDGNALRRVVA